ncbi:Hypothetical predicted protein [Olea europaea subsp. europaea]|uniref:Uncharacterized protein n=2 Tax=Olea europaea subsp. europaea TaxID=158383 RepID=A0A8S0PVP0_OLEEU|nr:Hypothetical predicted protein [Olea europaea subsp. europaea]
MDSVSRFYSKVALAQKRGLVDDEEGSEHSSKRVKPDLESISRPEAQSGRRGSNMAQKVVSTAPRALDLNANLDVASNVVGDGTPVCIKEPNKLPKSGNEQKSRGFVVDLNAEDISSSINQDPFYPYKNYENLKKRDDSDCASSVGPVEEKDPMRVWNKMKQNNYLSTSYAAATMPKPRGRKNKNEVIKKNIELAKKEQVDRFARIAAPSGLLNGLNPGIINHVRNSKQVHSIIEAVVKSAKTENQQPGSKQTNQRKSATKEFSERKNLEHMDCGGVNEYGVNHEDNLSGRWQMSAYPSLSKSISLNSYLTGGDGEPYKAETRISGGVPSQYAPENEDGLALKLSSSLPAASENTCPLLKEESANLSGVTSLSVKAANAASQWLELLYQDIKGRLAALRRSKKRVRAVIHTELPLLVSREFTSNRETDMHITTDSVARHPDKAAADAHFVRWSTRFAQMDKTLCEEENLLETWLKQVKEMQLHCEWGLYKHSGHRSLQHMGNDCRLGETDISERDLSIRAAAASIYSTCNFLLSMENFPHP